MFSVSAAKGGHKAHKGSPPYSDDASDHSSDMEDAEDYRKGASMLLNVHETVAHARRAQQTFCKTTH